MKRPLRYLSSHTAQLLFVAFVHIFIAVHRQQWPVEALDLGLLAILSTAAWRRRIPASIPVAYATVVISAMADLDSSFPLAVFVLMAPVFFLVRLLPDWKSTIGYGLWTGGLIASGVVSWIWKVMTSFWGFPTWVTLLLYLLVCAIMGFEFAPFLVLTRWITRKTSVPLGLAAPTAFALVEYWYPTPFPMQLAMATISTPLHYQIADLCGMTGLTLVLGLVSGAILMVVENLWRRRWYPAIAAALLGLLLLGFQLGYGTWALKHYAPSPQEPGLRVAMIQPMSPLKILNVDHETKLAVARKLVQMSREAVTSGTLRPDLLIWPEGAAPFAYTTPSFNPEFVEAIRTFQHDCPVTMTFQDIEFTAGEEPGRVRYYNHISVIGPDGAYLGGYQKNFPMPFTEYLPGEHTFPWLRKIFPETRSVLRGQAPTLLPGPQGPFAPLICYEILEAAYIRRFVDLGARYIINYTNDRYYGDTQLPYQHLAYAIMRAVENRRPVIRSTNSGISALIDARGIIAPGASTGVMQEAILRGTIHPRDGQSLYGRWGDWLPRWLLTPAFLGAVAWILVRDRKKRVIEASAEGSRKPGKKSGKSHRRRGGKGKGRRGN